MKIGIVMPIGAEAGGVYQYADSLVEALAAYDVGSEYILFVTGAQEQYGKFSDAGMEIVRYQDALAGIRDEQDGSKQSTFSLLRSARSFAKRVGLDHLKKSGAYHKRLAGLKGNVLAEEFSRHSIDLAIYPNHNGAALFARTPFIMAIHDIQHRFQPEFPEVSADGTGEARDWFFNHVPQEARAVLVDSDVGKEDVAKACGIETRKIEVLPFIAPPYLLDQISDAKLGEVKKKYSLHDQYLFYPAQFWPHKNHALIIEAIGRLKREKGLEYSAVFVGNKDCKFSTYESIIERAHELEVEAQIKYLGYVHDEEMLQLYTLATCLVMPTFFGPTNIPALEAFVAGTPVITSDIRGIREQIGDAGLLVDPRSPDDLADALFRMFSDEPLRESLRDLGRKRVASWTQRDFALKLIDIIESQKQVVPVE